MKTVPCNANFDSRNDKFTFEPSNPQIAHIFGSVGYALTVCKAGILPGRISIGTEGEQSIDSCKPFDWDAAGEAGGYCNSRADTPLLLIEIMPSNFSFANIDYQIEMTLLTDGVYFTNPIRICGFFLFYSRCL